MKKSARFAVRRTRGFTLVELLVVIAIIAILAAVVVLIINPLELTRRGRDSTRITDIANLQNAINVAVQEATSSGEEVLCVGSSYPCNGSSLDSGARAVDGSGWVKVNLSASAQSVSVPTLPLDPINNAANHYTYCADNDVWEIDAAFESQQYLTTNDRDGTDGGDDTALYEVGSGLNVIAPSGGSCTY